MGVRWGEGESVGVRLGRGGRVQAVGDVGLGRGKREDREEARQERRDGEEGDREEGAENILR